MSSSVSWPYISGSRVPSRLRLGPDRTKTTGSWDKGRAFGCEDARSPYMGCTAKGKEGQWRWSRSRSEEHTSELQSLMRISYAVFCLKKKKRIHKRQFTPPPYQ